LVNLGFKYKELSKQQYLIDGKRVAIVDETSDMLPMVSVTMITYNHEKFIKQAIEGVLMQKTSFKVVLVIGEDCSTDETRKIVCEYQRNNRDKIILKLPDENLGVNINSVSNKLFCKGKYIAECEGDDYWTDPYKLQKQVDFLEANPDYVTCFHDAIIINGKGDYISSFYTEKQIADGAKNDCSSEDLIKGKHAITCTRVFRNIFQDMPKEMASAPGGDVFLTSLLGHFGKGKFIHDIKPAAYRVSSSGVFSMKPKSNQLYSMLMTRLQLYKYYKRIDFKKETIDFFFKRFIGHTKHAFFLAFNERSERLVFECYFLLLRYLGLNFFRSSYISIHKSFIKFLIMKVTLKWNASK
jgi:glycosyltransferase involved in cell wall biosynthesis